MLSRVAKCSKAREPASVVPFRLQGVIARLDQAPPPYAPPSPTPFLPRSRGRGSRRWRAPSLGGTSRMMREYHVRICEGLGVKFPESTMHHHGKYAKLLAAR